MRTHDHGYQPTTDRGPGRPPRGGTSVVRPGATTLDDSRYLRITFAMHAITVAMHLCGLAGLTRIEEQLMLAHLEAQAERERA